LATTDRTTQQRTRFLKAITPRIAIISMGASECHRLWTAWEHGHPRKVTFDLLVSNTQGTRTAKQVLVATGQHAFVEKTLRKAIYVTGWDGTVVLEATAGNWRILEGGQNPIDIGADLSSRLNINMATVEQLTKLPMIGEKRAEKIVQFRRANGPFTTVGDLANIPGIGGGTVKMLRDLVRTS